jgi:hypothetical protein
MFSWLRELFAMMGLAARTYKDTSTIAGGSDVDKAIAAAELAEKAATLAEAKAAETK